MLAETNTTAIALLVLGGLLAVLSIVALVLRHRSKARGPRDPAAMRPGPSDTALETPVLQRLQGWGLVLVVFFVAWFPLQWLLEPGGNLTQEEELKTIAIERGELAVLPFSEENQLGVGCVRCHGPELKGGADPVPGRVRLPARPHDGLRPADARGRSTIDDVHQGSGRTRACPRGASGTPGP